MRGGSASPSFGIWSAGGELRAVDIRCLFQDGVHIENQPNPAVAQNRSSSDARKPLEHAAQTLDDDFLLSDDFVHHQAKGFGRGLHHHQHALMQLHAAWTEAEAPVQPRYGQQTPAHQHHLVAVFQREARLGLGAENLAYRIDRNDIAFFADLHQQSVDDRKRQRKLQEESRANAGPRFDVDSSAQFLQLLAHDIHSNAPPGDIRDHFGGGKSRLKDQVENLFVAQRRTFLNQAALQGLVEDLLPIQSAAVVSHLHHDAPGLMVGFEANAGGWILARRPAL